MRVLAQQHVLNISGRRLEVAHDSPITLGQPDTGTNADLAGQTRVMFGAVGPVGSVVATELAAEGADAFLPGHCMASSVAAFVFSAWHGWFRQMLTTLRCADVS